MALDKIEAQCGLLRSQLKPGDIMLKLYFDSIGDDPIGYAIHKATGSHYVHGGIAGESRGAGQSNFIYDVNGGLPHDKNEGVYGRHPVPAVKRDSMLNSNRLLPNIYKSSLEKDMKATAYHVWRCRRRDIAELVHREAAPFVVTGTRQRWQYNFSALALEKRSILKSAFSQNVLDEQSRLEKEREIIREGGSFVEAAVSTKRSFFCTEWIVWMYKIAAYKVAQSSPHPSGMDISIPAYDAGPGQLAEALTGSRDFAFVGEILPNFSN